MLLLFCITNHTGGIFEVILKKICYVTQLHSELHVSIQIMMLTEMRKYTFLFMLDPIKVGEMGYSFCLFLMTDAIHGETQHQYQ